MPSTVRELFAAHGLEPAGRVCWGQRLRDAQTGVYVVALSDNADSRAGARPDCPLDGAALDRLARVCPELQLDGKATTAARVGERIASFWIADEVIVYIGRAGQSVGSRIGQYYRTPIGAPRPHKGGWWIKTLTVLPDLYVHWARTPHDIAAEDAMLDHFAAHLSPASTAALPMGPVMPFANLMDAADRRKVHGIRNATSGAPARRSSPDPLRPRSGTRPAATATQAPPAGRQRPAASAIAVTTQPVTAADRAAGRIRFPRGAKHLLPEERADLTVRLHGQELVCRWDPRFGPPERSGVLTVGRAFAGAHLTQDEALTVRIDGDVIVLSQ
jgi:hypothetical protein